MESIVKTIHNIWNRRPLLSIMAVGLFFRLIAAYFSRGYAMHDDHFCVIDAAQQWLSGAQSFTDAGDNIRSLIYPWLHYALFFLLEKIGVWDPQAKMLVVRLLHAVYSMALVFFGFKTARLITDEKKARLVGLLLAVFWVLPFMSVRNLIEYVCVPPMAAGIYFAVKHDIRHSQRWLLALSGIMMGCAFTLRFQTIVFGAGVGIVFLCKKQWARAAWYATSMAVAIAALQTISDVCIAHTYPLAAFVRACTEFAVSDPHAYPMGPWYQYIGLLIGVLIPPMSLLMLWGYFTSWKKYALIFWPTVLFLIVHSSIVNKQERFILPVVPFVLMLSVIGVCELFARVKIFSAHPKMVRGLWWWFWVVNTLLLCVVSTTYTKKSRVETLSYLTHKQDLRGILIETTDNTAPLAPLFYLTKPIPVYYLPSTKKIETLKTEIDSMGGQMPNYVIFLSQNDMDKRLERLSGLLPGLRFDCLINPSFIDNVLYILNPRHNVNQSSSIYAVQ